MKKLKLLSLATAMVGLGFVALTNPNPTTVHASAYKQIASKDYSANPPAYKVKVPGKTAYMWTKNHGRKIHNLKNYPRTTWYVQKSVKFRHNGKNSIYWQVQNASGKVKGLVWRQYFKPGGVKKANTGSSKIKGTKPTTTTPKVDPAKIDESLNNQLLALFPGTVHDAKLQKLAEAYPTEKLIISGYGSWQADSSTFIELLKNQLGSQYSKLTVIGPSTNNDEVEPRPSLFANKISFTNYIKQNSAIYGGLYPIKRFNFSDYQGYNIGVYASPKSITSNYKTQTKGYGDFVVLLLKN